MPTPKEVLARGAKWAPYRTIASWCLWRVSEGGSWRRCESLEYSGPALFGLARVVGQHTLVRQRQFATGARRDNVDADALSWRRRAARLRASSARRAVLRRCDR
jgi:hypothetical protein